MGNIPHPLLQPVYMIPTIDIFESALDGTLSSSDHAGILFSAVPDGILFPAGPVGPVGPDRTLSRTEKLEQSVIGEGSIVRPETAVMSECHHEQTCFKLSLA